MEDIYLYKDEIFSFRISETDDDVDDIMVKIVPK